jgi:formylglycine-generating enzyme required for sulfatase activity
VAACIDRGEYPGVGQTPRTHVSLAEAEHACRDRAHRLCTSEEWLRACTGPQHAAHPYGAQADSTRCNIAVATPSAPVVEPSGARAACTTATGVADLEGNVAEWVEDGAALGGDATTRTASCASRAQPGDDTRAPTLGFRCCVSLP